MSKEGGSYFRCRYSYLCETGFICSNGCALKDKKPCPYTDYMPKCPSYERPYGTICQTDFADAVDADVKIFTNPMGEWHADPMGGNTDNKGRRKRSR